MKWKVEWKNAKEAVNCLKIFLFEEKNKKTKHKATHQKRNKILK